MRIDFISKGAKFGTSFHQIILKIEGKLFSEISNFEIFYKKQDEILNGLQAKAPVEDEYFWHDKLSRAYSTAIKYSAQRAKFFEIANKNQNTKVNFEWEECDRFLEAKEEKIFTLLSNENFTYLMLPEVLYNLKIVLHIVNKKIKYCLSHTEGLFNKFRKMIREAKCQAEAILKHGEEFISGAREKRASKIQAINTIFEESQKEFKQFKENFVSYKTPAPQALKQKSLDKHEWAEVDSRVASLRKIDKENSKFIDRLIRRQKPDDIREMMSMWASLGDTAFCNLHIRA